MIIAIDGTAGSGKSTAARMVAGRLGLQHLDSGSVYRIIALAALDGAVDVTDEVSITELAHRTVGRLTLAEGIVHVDGTPVGSEIRTPEVSEAASLVARHPSLREVVVTAQRALVPVEGAVIDGRDIGTVVWPSAEVKVWLDANAETRAVRHGVNQIDVSSRDQRDAQRPVGAAVPAPDAVVIDSSTLSPEQVTDAILSLLPTEHPPIAYRIFRGFIVPLMRILFRIRVLRKFPIPSGAVILAANHRSFLDIPALAMVTERQVHFMAKREVLDSWAGGLLKACGAYPVSRGVTDRQAIRHTLAVLKGGGVVGIYPAGTRTRGGGFEDMNDGVAWLALQSGAPVVPVALSGTDEVFPPERKFPSFRQVRVATGRPVRFGGPHGSRPPRQEVREATAQLADMGAELLKEIE